MSVRQPQEVSGLTLHCPLGWPCFANPLPWHAVASPQQTLLQRGFSNGTRPQYYTGCMSVLTGPAFVVLAPPMMTTTNPTIAGSLPDQSDGKARPKSENTQKQRAPKPLLGSEDPLSGPIEGRVCLLVKDPQGCRRVQDIFAGMENDDGRMTIVEEMRGSIWELSFCPEANHMIQQVIASMRSAQCGFMIDEIVSRGPGSVCKAARHVYACRVLQRILEHWPDQSAILAQDLVQEGIILCRHAFGNYVMQHVLEYGSPKHRSRLIREMALHVLGLGCDLRAGATLTKALENACKEDQLALATAILSDGKLASRMACSRHGHTAALALADIEGSHGAEAVSQLLRHKPQLKQSRYGRVVLHRLAEIGADSNVSNRNK